MKRVINNQEELRKFIAKGYTITSGTVGGHSIEVVENCLSYVYYDDVEARDRDLKAVLGENAS